MNNDLTEIVFILDRSGSMQYLTKDTIGGFNSFIENQKKEVGEAKLTTVLFDDKYEILHNGVDIKNIKPITEKDYYTRGMTALLDSIGKSISDVGYRLSKTNENDRPSKVIFVITTDGEENSSKEFNQSQIKEMIEHQKKIYNWNFIFLGANIDAVGVANSFGISSQFASSYTASSVGTDALFTTMSKTIGNYRGTGNIDYSWKDDIQ
jgi:uncharacterized protein YegL